MSKGQWTVAGLILLLLGLEAIRNKTLSGWFTGIWVNFNQALTSASGSSSNAKH